ncbi:MAG: pyridoxal phosphate-dependent aminotransferase [Clostridioides sp.]|jgi:cystathionine beta-lyase|nr:pyridoxal phosphate-dependent aminotransferase [Clostridioides sp.]
MYYNFDKVVDRDDEYNTKWADRCLIFGKDDVLPMWIADMDFETAPAITEALTRRASTGMYGYVSKPRAYDEAIVNWIGRRHGWKIQKDWLVYSPGVVPILSMAVSDLTEPGDKVMILEPVYPPFIDSVKSNKRELVVSELKKNKENYYEMDFEDIESKIKDVKLFMFCNPHNPVGRVWTREELKKLGELCLKYNVKVLSDEIHSDLIFRGNKHIPLASISKEFEQNTVTCMAPTKTFNLAGVQVSYAIAPNEESFKKISFGYERLHMNRNNIFSIDATIAAYNESEDWLESLLEYIEGNVDFAVDYIGKNMPELKVRKPQGTYLLWIDFNNLGRSNEEVGRALIDIGKIGLNSGVPYGDGGELFYRVNLACPRSTVEEGLKRIKIAVDSLGTFKGIKEVMADDKVVENKDGKKLELNK